MFRILACLAITALSGALIGACSAQRWREPTACYLPLDCRGDRCPTYSEITKEIEGEARRVRERRTQWLAWMQKRRPQVSEEDAERAVPEDPAGWRGAPDCGGFTVFHRGDGFTSATVYFDPDLRLVAIHTTTDVRSGNPACELWTHYGPEITCAR